MSTTYKPDTRVSEYLLERCIGIGAFSEVWKARHHVWTDDRVAVKLPIQPEYVRFLRREGVVVHGLRHPNIVRVMGFDPYGEIPYLIMEFVDGPSLREVIDQHPEGLPIDVARVVLEGMLRAIDVAHHAGIIHRDIKPANVLLNLGGRPVESLQPDDVRVSDFGFGEGLTDTLRSIAQSASLERDDKLVGTLAYMAPEIRDARQRADARTDLYAIGIVLFEMLTGERPAGAELPSTMRAEAGAFDDVFRGLYARHDRRFESAADVMRELVKLTPEGLPAIPPVPPPVPHPPLPAESAVACSACQAVVEPGDQFCTQCGAQLNDHVRRCRSCGAFPGPYDRFCIMCGATLDQDVSV